jgi:hypothetical protein
MYQVKVESWTYQTGLNNTPMRAYQAHVENENGTWIEEAPVRDSREAANDDARLFRERYSKRTSNQ